MESRHEILNRMPMFDDAKAWAESYATMDEAWSSCHRADWMLWIAGKCAGPSRIDLQRQLAGARAEIAEDVLPIFEARFPGDRRPREKIDLARRFAGGEAVSPSDMRGPVPADRIAYASALAAALVCDAAAYAAAAYDAAADARSSALARYADIVRKWIPKCPTLEPEVPDVGEGDVTDAESDRQSHKEA